MDSKITMSFNGAIIEETKKLAQDLGISLSRFTEIMYRKALAQKSMDIEQYPISDWVNEIAESEVSYNKPSKSRKSLKTEYFESKR